MRSVIYSRLFGQVAAVTMHSINSIVMFSSMQDEQIMSDPEIRTMVSMQFKYATVWNIGFQLFYFSLAFVCDYLTLKSKDHVIPERIKKFRLAFFATLIWPVAMLIFVMFWPIFITNRELLFPAFIDKIFSFKSNMVMHFWILPAALWELTFLPRPVPKSHLKNIGVLTLTFFVYIVVINYTYHQRGLWPYPIMKMMYGTIYYPLFIIAMYMLSLYCYNTQWKFTTIAWSDDKREGNKIKL